MGTSLIDAGYEYVLRVEGTPPFGTPLKNTDWMSCVRRFDGCPFSPRSRVDDGSHPAGCRAGTRVWQIGPEDGLTA